MNATEPEPTLTSLEAQLLKETRLNAPFRAAFQHSPIGFALLSLAGYCLEVNPALERLLGCAREELMSRPLAARIHPDDRDHHAAQLAALLKGDHVSYQIETHYVRDDGRTITTLQSVCLIHDETHRPAYFVLQLVDLTAQRRLVTDLQHSNTELQRFAYSVSHDLRAPLRGIHTLLQWIRDDYAHNLDEDGQQMVRAAMVRVEKMDAMIQGILEYSRAGAVDASRSPIDMNVLVRDVAELLVPAGRFTFEILSPLPVVTMNPFRAQQIFQNLIDNAVKFNHREHGSIQVRCERRGAEWVFHVSDDGPGIEAAYHERIFNLFEKGSPARREGSGLGLAIVRRIVETESGQIWVTTNGRTTFSFSLPAHPTP